MEMTRRKIMNHCVQFILALLVLLLCVGQWLCEVERFDPSTNQWSLIAPMHHSRTGVAVTALRGTTYNTIYHVHIIMMHMILMVSAGCGYISASCVLEYVVALENGCLLVLVSVFTQSCTSMNCWGGGGGGFGVFFGGGGEGVEGVGGLD